MRRNRRSSFNTYEDVRMLKWVARGSSDSPLGIRIWNQYVEHHTVPHTAQSLNGRMRRQIIPNICEYIPFLEMAEIEILYNIFRTRFDSDTRNRLRSHIFNASQKMEDASDDEKCEDSENGQEENNKSETVEDVDENSNRSSCADKNDDDSEIVGAELPVEEIPEVQEEPSLASTVSTIAIEEKVEEPFSIESWNLDMRPVAESAVKEMYEHIVQCLEGRPVPQQELADYVEGENVQQLFGKMLTENKDPQSDFVLVNVPSFLDKNLRLSYFVRIQEELKKFNLTPHIRSAVLTFFLFFEYTVADTVDGDVKAYSAILDRLVPVAMNFAIL